MLLGGSWRNSSIPPESDFCFGSIQPWWWFIEKGQRVFFQDHISICSYSTIQKLFTPTCLQDVEKNHSYKSALKMPWFHSKYLCDRRRSWRTWTHALWRCNGEDVREVTTGGSNGFQIHQEKSQLVGPGKKKHGSVRVAGKKTNPINMSPGLHFPNVSDKVSSAWLLSPFVADSLGLTYLGAMPTTTTLQNLTYRYL